MLLSLLKEKKSKTRNKVATWFALYFDLNTSSGFTLKIHVIGG